MPKKDRANGTAEQAKTATLAQQAMRPPALPNPDDGNILDRVAMNDAAARKRKGFASTIMAGASEKPRTAVKTLVSGGY